MGNKLPKISGHNEEEEEEEKTFEDSKSAKGNNSHKQGTWINYQKTFKQNLKSTENGNVNK
ncbi:18123_t:CDS:2 [Gigaspora margarita]|uniref:18123_t:CDS:1 n=1 Tax=Gigaspora margarita TaxID=4874 RepID=A0ABN7UIB2_GIGMA|nr:18123_t:CDS:2 [Gigaspora margarita]